MTFKPKLVAFDLDGTLAESKQRMSPEMGELLARLLQKMPVAVMSGAAYYLFENQFLPALPENARLDRLCLFPTNAAQCYVYLAGVWKQKYNYNFTNDEKQKILAALDEALTEVGLHGPPPQVSGERIEDRGTQISFSPLGQQASLDAKEQWKRTNNELRKQLHRILTERLPDFSVLMGGLTTIDITRKGMTKAYGIKKLVELSGISVSEMLYVGDALEEGGNDAVVKESGVRTAQVFGPKETATLIKSLL